MAAQTVAYSFRPARVGLDQPIFRFPFRASCTGGKGGHALTYPNNLNRHTPMKCYAVDRTLPCTPESRCPSCRHWIAVRPPKISRLGATQHRHHHIREKVRRALRDGRLTQLPCEVAGCGDPNSEAHHDDYSKPLEVTWLCFEHHKELHRLVGRNPQNHASLPL